MNGNELRARARRHLGPHFTRKPAWDSDFPIFVRGEGSYLIDTEGDRYLDGLAGLFCVNMGHGRSDIAKAAADQVGTLAYASNWGMAHPPAIEAASLIAELAPGDLGTTFFVNSGSEAVETAVKFARQYHRSQGQPERTKIISREMAYHGTTLGALSVTQLPKIKEPFGPLLPGVRSVPNTLGYLGDCGPARELPCVQAIEDVIAEEGPETIAALFAEPVQNGRGALVPPDGYWQELRAICDKYGILLVSDEVICSFGRLGHWFGHGLTGVVPDMITFAKGSTSGYAPLGGMIAREQLVQDLFGSSKGGVFTHGATWGGHPVSTAVATANITAMRDENVLGNVADRAPKVAAALDSLQKVAPLRERRSGNRVLLRHRVDGRPQQRPRAHRAGIADRPARGAPRVVQAHQGDPARGRPRGHHDHGVATAGGRRRRARRALARYRRHADRRREGRAALTVHCTACTALSRDITSMSLLLHPRDRSFSGAESPCRMGPSAMASPRRSASL